MSPWENRRLRAAPELLTLHLVEDALDTLLTALELEHPTLDEPPFAPAPVTLRRARTLARHTRRLLDQLERYRRAVDAVLAELNADDDIPF